MTDQNPMRIAEEMRKRLSNGSVDDQITIWVDREGIGMHQDDICSARELLALADALDEERKHADRLAEALEGRSGHSATCDSQEHDLRMEWCNCNIVEIAALLAAHTEKRNS